MAAHEPSRPPIGRRIIVVGPSCSGKTTLGAEIARRIGGPFIELDALFWKPGWTAPSDEEFRARLIESHTGDTWVSAGNYLRHTRHLTWPRADTIIWLDFPLRLTTRRVLARSWRRWRSKELLWGTNRERFWDQLMLWSPNDSLIAYNVSRHRQNRRIFRRAMEDARAAGKCFLRLESPRTVERLLENLAADGEMAKLSGP
ncbi:MAG: adenylate kinase [Dehalococcoidia bacterium]|nr:adenylate kinase [Dehalococcoidia bacterium]